MHCGEKKKKKKKKTVMILEGTPLLYVEVEMWE